MEIRGVWKTRKVYIDSHDYCEEARLDTQKLINLVEVSSERTGYINTNRIDQADLLIYYACGHLKSKEEESINDIKKLLSLKKSTAELLVWGCLTKINPPSLQEIYAGPLIGPEDWDFFQSYFNLSKNECDIHANTLNICNIPEQIAIRPLSQRERLTVLYTHFVSQLDRFVNFGKRKELENTWYIKIVSGCNNCCTYCSDRLAYKHLRSQPIERIIKQFELGLSKGYRHFFLVGRDLGSYGYDIDFSLPDLLKIIIKKFGEKDFKINLTNVSPNSIVEMYPKLNQVLDSKKIVYLGSHIQSGSNRILKLMGKFFPLSKWVEILNDIEKKYPDIKLETSIMVGFPSETDDDFKKSAILLNNVLFDRIVVYEYNERPNLPSLRIEPPIPQAIKNSRYIQMSNCATLCETKKWIRHGHFFSLATLDILLKIVLMGVRALARKMFSLDTASLNIQS